MIVAVIVMQSEELELLHCLISRVNGKFMLS